MNESVAGLKNNAIVREIPDICGNYLLCDTSIAFFFNRELNGYAFENATTVGKLHDIFVYNFWNNAKQEFVADIKPIAEQTFDVAPVGSNDSVIIDRSALEVCPYEECINKADSFVTQTKVSDWIKNNTANAILFFDRQGCKNVHDWLLKTEGRIIKYTDSSVIPLCKSNGDWYVLNSVFDKPTDNTGKLFAVKMEEAPLFENVYTLKDLFTYREAVGKTMFCAKDFSPIAIAESDTEERLVSYDYKQFKKIIKMTDAERETVFDKIHILLSDKLAASVSFTVTMTVKQLSKGAVLAPVYAEYEKFTKQRDEAVKRIKSDIDSCEANIAKYEKDLQNLKNEISEFKARETEHEQVTQNQSDIESRMKVLYAQLEKGRSAKKEADSKEIELKKNRRQYDDTKKEIATLQKKKKNVDSAQKKLEDLKKKISTGEAALSDLKNEFRSLTDDEKTYVDLQRLQKENAKKIADFQKHKDDGKKLEQKKAETQEKLDAETDRFSGRKKLLDSISALAVEPQTVAECQKIKTVLSEFNFSLPAFDKPVYGTLYKVKNVYEYELRSDEDSDDAEAEMERANISAVEFVSMTK